MLKHHVYDKKCKITLIMCSDNILTTMHCVLYDLMKIARKIYHYFFSIYHNIKVIDISKVVPFEKMGCYS